MIEKTILEVSGAKNKKFSSPLIQKDFLETIGKYGKF